MMHSGASATLKNLLCIKDVFKNDAQWSIGHPKKPPLHHAFLKNDAQWSIGHS